MSDSKKCRWTIASARQNFPTVVGWAAREPQDIYRRNELVARVVGADAVAQAPARPSARVLLKDIQRICAEEKYELPVAPRSTRSNAFVSGAKPKPRRVRGS
jgi:hypothetical protein